ncbi:MAG: hypothetical protein SangKO_092750 [Sandaracinaceae bacterium]
MTRLIVAAALCLCALLFATSSAQAQGDAPRLVVVGDSHVERLGPMLARRAEAAGLQSAGWLARRGWSTSRYVREGDLAAQLEARGRPEVVVVSLGGNDRPRNRARYQRQLAWIVRQAREAGAERVLWLGPASSDASRGPRAEMTRRWHENNADLQSEMMAELGVEWIDSRPVTHEGHGVDGIHFTGRGYVHWADHAAGFFRDDAPVGEALAAHRPEALPRS